MKDLTAEIKLVRARQNRLSEEVSLLDGRIQLLETEVSEQEWSGVAMPIEAELPPKGAIEVTIAESAETVEAPAPVREMVPPPLLPAPSASKKETRPSVSDTATDSFEFRFGAVWAVRLGIVIFLTGLVFLGSYAYENYITHFGPLPRALMLYAIAGGMIGAGWWLERREKMVQFARVVMAGGLAATFFTTWASHHLEPLRWITSGVVDAVLLLGWTGVMGWAADRRKSQLLAGFSLLLAYYTCVITPAAAFSLVAMLLLSGAALFFLVKNGWSGVAMAALPATYGAFAFWQFFYPAVTGQGLALNAGVGLGFLACYWAVFTLAVFLTTQGKLEEGVATAWAAVNNTALFSLGTALLLAHDSPRLWLWSGAVGTACLALAYLAEKRRAEAPALSRVYLATGLTFVTVAMFQRWQGFSLALLLATESLLLLLVSHRHWRPWYLAGSLATGLLGMGIALLQLEVPGPAALWAAIAVGAVQLGQGWLEDRHARRVSSDGTAATGFIGLGVVTTLALILARAGETHQSFWLIGLTVVAIGGLRWHGLRALVLGAHVWLAAGLLRAMTLYWGGKAEWVMLALAGLAAVCVAQWWQRNRLFAPGDAEKPWVQLAFAAVEGMVVGTLVGSEVPESWRALAFLGAGVWLVLKAGGLGSGNSAVIGLLLGLAGAGMTALEIAAGGGSLGKQIAEIAMLAGLAGAFPIFERLHAKLVVDGCEKMVRPTSQAGALLAGHGVVVLGLMAIFRHAPLATATWVVALLGLAAMFLAQHWKRWTTAACVGAGMLLLAVGAFCLQAATQGGFALSAVMVPVALLLARRTLPGEHAAKSSMLIAGVGMLWWFVSMRLIEAGGGFALTIGWAGLAAGLFALGLGLRERGYRWAGLALLAASLLRLVFIDLWQLGTLTRVSSCMVLGLLLVAIGFTYNRFGERLRKYL